MKKIPILSNIFGRTRNPVNDELQTDAVPIDDPPGASRANSETFGNSPSLTSGDFNAALQLQEQMAESQDLSMVRTNTNTNTEVVESPTGNTSITNNQMALHQTQGQVVMQFSNITGLHFGSVYNFNNEKPEKPVSESGGSGGGSVQSVKSGRPRRTTTIDAMMKSSEELNHRIMDTISTHLGEGWRSVIRDLGLSEGQIDQATIDHQVHGGLKEVIYQLLLTWTRGADDDEATLGIITTLLWKSGHRECVEKMKETWKQENAARTANPS